MINLNNLQVFITVANLESIRKAARVLHLTQPGITNQIKSLEKFLAVKLFNRDVHGVTLTPAGKLFYVYAEDFLSLYNRLDTDLKSLHKNPQDILSLGATSSLGHYPLPDCLHQFTTANPAIKIDYRVEPRQEIIKLLKENILDVAVVEGPINDDKLATIDIANDEIIILAPANESWQGKTEITFDEFKQNPFFSHAPGCGVMELFYGALTARGYNYNELRCMLESNHYPNIIRLVMEGKGLSVGSRMSISNEIESGQILPLKIKGIDVPITYQIVCLPNKVNKNAVRQFNSFLMQIDLPCVEKVEPPKVAK